MARCYFQIYIVDRHTFCPDTYFGNGFSDFIIPCWRFWGGYCFGVVCPSFIFTSVRLAMDYGKLTKGALWSHLPPTTDLLPLTKWESCQLLANIWGKHWLWHPGRSLKDRLLIMALNPIQTTINRWQTTDIKNLWILYVFLFALLLWWGIWIFSKFACLWLKHNYSCLCNLAHLVHKPFH